MLLAEGRELLGNSSRKLGYCSTEAMTGGKETFLEHPSSVTVTVGSALGS